MRTERLSKEEILDQVEEILLDQETPQVAKLRAADLLLRDLSGNITTGERTEKAQELLTVILGETPSKSQDTETGSTEGQVGEALQKWSNSLSEEQKRDGFQVREIMEVLIESFNIKRQGNLLYKTKHALRNQNWLSRRCASRGMIYFIIESQG